MAVGFTPAEAEAYRLKLYGDAGVQIPTEKLVVGVKQNDAGQATSVSPVAYTDPQYQPAKLDPSLAVSINLKSDGGLDIKLPDILVNNTDFMKQLQPLVDTKVQYDANGTPQHPLLQQESVKLLDNAAAAAQEAEDRAREYANVSGYNEDQYRSIADAFISQQYGGFGDDAVVDIREAQITGEKPKTIFGDDVSQLLGKFGKTKTVGVSDEVKQLKLSDFKNYFNSLSDEAQDVYVKALRDKAEEGDVTSAKALYSLESTGAFEGTLMDAVEGFNKGLYGEIGNFATNIVDAIPKSVNLARGEGFSGGIFENYRDNNERLKDLEFTSSGKIGTAIGETTAIIPEIATSILAGGPAAAAAGAGLTGLGTTASALTGAKAPLQIAQGVLKIADTISTKYPIASKFMLDIDDAIFSVGASDNGDDLVREMGQNLIFGAALTGGVKAANVGNTVLKNFNTDAVKRILDGTGQQKIIDSINSLETPAVKGDTIDSILGGEKKIIPEASDVLNRANEDVAQRLQGQDSLTTTLRELGNAGIVNKLSDPAFDTNKELNFNFTQAYESGKFDAAQKILDDAGVKNFNVRDVQNAQNFLFDLVKKTGGEINKLDNHLSRSLYMSKDALRAADVDTSISASKTASQQLGRQYKSAKEFLDNEGTINDISVLRNMLEDYNQAVSTSVRRASGRGLLKEGIVLRVNDNLSDGTFKVATPGKKPALTANAKTLVDNGLVEVRNETFKKLVGSEGQRYFTSADNARKIEAMYSYTPEMTNWVDTALEKAANFSKTLQNLTLAGGLPGTPLNNYAVREIVNASLMGNSKQALEAIGSSFSKEATTKFILDNMDDILRAARDGGRFLPSNALADLGGKVPEEAMTIGDTPFNDVADIVESNWFDSALKGVPGRKAQQIKEAIKNTSGKLDDAFSAPTFDRLLPTLQIKSYQKLFEQNLAKGMDEVTASRAAVKTVKSTYSPQELSKAVRSIGGRFGSSSRLNKLANIFFLAPQFRKTMVTRMIDSARALATPSIWKDPVKRAENILNIRWGLSVIAGLIGLNAYTALTEGKSSFETGRPFDEISLGKAGKSDIGFQLLGSSGTVPRIGGRIIKSILEGDPGEAANQFINSTSILMQPLVRAFVTGEDWRGDSIKNPNSKTDITPAEEWRNIGTYLLTQYSGHPYVRSLRDFSKGNYLDALSTALESPINVRRLDRTAYAEFNNNVVNKSKRIIEQYQEDINNSYDDPARQEKLKKKVFEAIKSQAVEPWIRSYGSYLGVESAADLPDDMANKLMYLILDDNFLPGGEDNPQNAYEESLADKGRFAERDVYREVAQDVGLDLVSDSTAIRDFAYKSFGAPAEMRFDANNLINGDLDKNIQSLWDIKESYDDRISTAYDIEDFETMNMLQNEYMQIYKERVAPLVNKYGPNAVTKNRQLVNDLTDLIMVPSDYMKNSKGKYYSAKKFPNLEKKRGYARSYLKSLLGTGGGDIRNVPTDQEVLDQIEVINNKVDIGRISSARSQAKRLKKKLDAGNLYADPTSAQDIQNLIDNL